MQEFIFYDEPISGLQLFHYIQAHILALALRLRPPWHTIVLMSFRDSATEAANASHSRSWLEFC